jgi:hypothetical protein
MRARVCIVCAHAICQSVRTCMCKCRVVAVSQWCPRYASAARPVATAMHHCESSTGSAEPSNATAPVRASRTLAMSQGKLQASRRARKLSRP